MSTSIVCMATLKISDICKMLDCKSASYFSFHTLHLREELFTPVCAPEREK